MRTNPSSLRNSEFLLSTFSIKKKKTLFIFIQHLFSSNGVEESIEPQQTSSTNNVISLKKNLAITFDNRSFALHTVSNRNDPTPDALKLNQLYKKLDCKVPEPFQNLNRNEIEETLKNSKYAAT